nr:AHS beta [Echiniscus testudo]
MALRFAALLLLVAVGVASAQRFSKHETIRALPESCQQHSGLESNNNNNDWSSQPFGSSSSRRNGNNNNGKNYGTVGPCKLLPPVHEDVGYEFCLKCKAGEKNGVTAEDLAQGIRQVIERKLKRNNQFTQRGAKLNIVIDGVKQPIDLTRVLANTPEVLEKVDDVFFFFPNGQIGRIEFEHGQPEELERITCRPPCRGGPSTASRGQSSQWSNNQNNDIDEDEDQEETNNNVHSSSSSRYLNNKNKSKNVYPSSGYSYGDSESQQPYGSSNSRRQQQTSGSLYGQTGYGRSANAGRYGDNQRRTPSRNNNNNNEEEEDDK